MGQDSATEHSKLTITRRHGEHGPHACAQSGRLDPVADIPASASSSSFTCTPKTLILNLPPPPVDHHQEPTTGNDNGDGRGTLWTATTVAGAAAFPPPPPSPGDGRLQCPLARRHSRATPTRGTNKRPIDCETPVRERMAAVLRLRRDEWIFIDGPHRRRRRRGRGVNGGHGEFLYRMQFTWPPAAPPAAPPVSRSRRAGHGHRRQSPVELRRIRRRIECRWRPQAVLAWPSMKPPLPPSALPKAINGRPPSSESDCSGGISRAFCHRSHVTIRPLPHNGPRSKINPIISAQIWAWVALSRPFVDLLRSRSMKTGQTVNYLNLIFYRLKFIIY